MPFTTIRKPEDFKTSIIDSPKPEIVIFGMASDSNTSKVIIDVMRSGAKPFFVDVDKQPNIAMAYSVRTVPLIMIWSGGLMMGDGSSLTPELAALLK